MTFDKFIDDDGIERFLGNNPAPIRFSWVEYGAVPKCPLIPRDKWKGLVDAMGRGPEAWYLPYVANQNGFSMCNASATTSAMESGRIRRGLDKIQLSAGDLYRRICGGRDQGSTLEDGIAEAMSDGMASVATCPYLDWRQRHQAAEDERKKYRVLEDGAFLCPTFDHVFSAVLMGFDIVSGISWYSNYKPDADGWLPSSGRGGVGGHAVHGYKPTYRGDDFGIWHKNSWGDWGPLHGLCVFPESAYAGRIGGWWALGSPTMEEGGIPAPVA